MVAEPVRVADTEISSGRFQAVDCTVIGLGAIGRPVSQLLAALGIGRLQLIDFDIVERDNLTTQGYSPADLGEPKVEAAAAAIRRLNPALAISTVEDRFRPAQAVGRVVFCCVDSIAARRAIWRAVEGRVNFWGDGRLYGDVLRVLVACDPATRAHYATTLTSLVDGVSMPCATNGTLAAATIAASLLVHQFTRWLRKLPVDCDACINLLASEWTLLASTSSPAAS
jgi:sulfur carrier protein ThiS adenylyltransferase